MSDVDPAIGGITVVPSDSVNFSATKPPRALWVGGAGNVSVLMSDGTSVVFIGCNAGSIIPGHISRVNLTGTTATFMVAMY